MLSINREKIKTALPFLANIIRYCKRRKNELSALSRHLNRKQFQKNNAEVNVGKIKVVFICQYIPAWSKNKQLYEVLKNDDQFEVLLLCIPNRISANRLQNPENMDNDTYDYYSKHGYKEAVNALIGYDKWFDLKSIHPDYVFYNRYDRPMPEPYTSTSVSEYAKVCLTIYGCALLRVEESMIDKTFLSNTFCFFAESEGIRKEFIKWNRILCGLKLSNAICCGITAVENAYKARDDYAKTWEFSNNSFRMIYAPRWTMDPTWGGSSFLKYKDFMLTLADKYKEIDILLRPHPLMFDHFINSGILSKEDAQQFYDAVDQRDNIQLDSEKEYQATFWNSSVLVCDYSSMMIEYFVTEKPIIYLTYDKNIDYTDQMISMLSACYIVSSEMELENVLQNLQKGIDPLADKRKVICKEEILIGDTIHASKNMRNILIEKYND